MSVEGTRGLNPNLVAYNKILKALPGLKGNDQDAAAARQEFVKAIKSAKGREDLDDLVLASSFLGELSKTFEKQSQPADGPIPLCPAAPTTGPNNVDVRQFNFLNQTRVCYCHAFA